MRGARRAAALAAAAVVVAAMAATARAEITGVQFSPGGAISAASLGSVTFRSASLSMSCPLTLNGSVASTLVEIGAEIGSITEVRVSNERCSGGTVRAFLINAGRPDRADSIGWLIREASTRCNQLVGRTEPERPCGYLIRNRLLNFQMSTFGGFINCLYEGDSIWKKLIDLIPDARRRNTYTTGLMTSVTPNAFRLVSGFGCPSEVEVVGTFGLSPVQTITFL